MTAQITVTRTPGEIEHHITVEVSLDKDGDVVALPVETVWEERWYFNSFTKGYDKLTTAIILADKGKDFELTDQEIEEAKKAIASNREAYEEDLSAGQMMRDFMEHDIGMLRGEISPLAGLNPPQAKREAFPHGEDRE